MDLTPDPGMLPLASTRELTAVREPSWPRAVIGLGAVGYGILVVTAVATGSFELLDAVPLIPILGYVTYRIGRKIAETDRDPAMVSFLLAAFSAKLLGTLLRALVVSALYNDRSDALDFHAWGKFYAPMFRGFDFSEVGSTSGTYFMRVMTGVIYSFTGSSKVSGSIVLSFLSFIGLLLLWRAFQRAIPTGAHRRYGLLVLFLPSFLYWPSALGKEGWSVFCLGVAAYGVALVLTRPVFPGVLLFTFGLLGITYLRPHVAITMFCGAGLAGLFGKSQRPSGKTPILRLILFGALFVVGVTLASSTSQFFGVESLTQETVNATLNEAEGRTSEAGSTFSPVSVSSNPANFPLAVVTVLFRPLPIEASSPVAAASALEGVFLLWLTWKSRRRLMSIFRCMRNQPYAAYCLGIIFTFIYAFSAFSNFGILARQRCQVLPFYLALLCLPVWTRRGAITSEAAIAGRDEGAPGPQPEASADLYPGLSGPGVTDPYSGGLADIDPYARFREDRTEPGHDDA